MQQFTTLLLRELRSGFRGLPAYFIIFTYLFAAIGAAFYFGSYLAMHDTALYAVFYAQPIILEGYTKFLFLNRNGLPKVAVNYESMFRGLVRKYNKTQKVALPKVMTPHTLRHTFCTTLANAGMNPKALQYIMGHSNINMTLNYYAHTTSETSITEMKRLIA